MPSGHFSQTDDHPNGACVRECGKASFIDQYPIDHVWIFLTDQCNLLCPHCFYHEKTSRQNIAHLCMRGLFSFLPSGMRHRFVLSGGEPFLVWPHLKHWVTKIARQYQDRYISVQTNMLLLDKAKISFLKKNNINLEIGIDGDEATTRLNRPARSISYQAHLCDQIKAWRLAGGRFTATMTVYPNGVNKLLDNVLYLDSLGLSSIEIHPAFLAPWQDQEAAVFLKEYKKACTYELKAQKFGLIGRGYSLPAKGVWDVLVTPQGQVLPNWTCLSFAEEVRQKMYVMNLGEGHHVFNPEAKGYFNAVHSFIKKMGGVVSYRQLSNFNIGQALKFISEPAMRGHINVYLDLCQRIEKIDIMCRRVGKGVQ